MIKVIAFDLVGVLVKEKDIELTEQEDKLERLFGPNISDEEFIYNSKHIINEDTVSVAYNIINKLYEVKDCDLFNNIRIKYPNIKIVIATNHITFIKDFILKNFQIEENNIYISASIKKIKPHKDFYEYILNDLGIEYNEMLFLDDNVDNINSALELGINAIKINKGTNILKEISKYERKIK